MTQPHSADPASTPATAAPPTSVAGAIAARPAWSTVLRALREARGVSQEGWAAWLEVGRSSVQRWERGETVPDAYAEDRLVAVCAGRGLLRTYTEGPLVGQTLTEAWLHRLLAAARLAISSRDVDVLGGQPGVAEPSGAPLVQQNLPTGTLTLLFTDIAGSTRLLQHLGERYAEVLTLHRDLLRSACRAHGGQEVDTQGDACFYVFASARQAVAAAVAGQRALASHPWPAGGEVRVRMGLHTGEPQRTAEGFVGLDVHRAARIAAAGHGGQVLLSAATADLVRAALPDGVALRELGQYRLKDLPAPEELLQLVITDLPSAFPPPRAQPVQRHNLPASLTSFVGREHELTEVRELLRHTRLLTLTGTGGVGKTRLALEAARTVTDEYPDGVWLVELAALTDPVVVPQAVATVLGVREQPGQAVADALGDGLGTRRMLLVLDNCEHLVDACAALVDMVLRAAPKVHVLATSREALRVVAETVYRVPSLGLPTEQWVPSPDRLTAYEAVLLFVERARAACPGFGVTDENSRAVLDVCQRLDGIPLALELAAARLRHLAVEQLAARLHDRFRLLTAGSRTALPRQQTLRATLEWSFDLLTEEERVLFRRLAVFAGGFSLAAAEAICAGEGIAEEQVLDLVAGLVDQSLVLTEEQHGDVRYRLLETVRQYGQEQLDAAGETTALRRRYRDWYVALAEQACQGLRERHPAIWLQTIEREQDNLRALLQTSTTATNAAEARRSLWEVLWRYWELRGHAEGMLLADRYLLADELGHGWFGAVYRAVDRQTGGVVAVKILRPSLAGDPATQVQVAREAAIIGALTAPAIVRLLELNEHAGIPFLIMEYLPGPTLADLVRAQGPLPVMDVLQIGLQLAQAMEYAHAHGVLHNDLKPANIKLVDGQVKVLDFGVARIAGEPAAHPDVVVLGTPAYLAPEQVHAMVLLRNGGSANAVSATEGTARTDIYAFGATLFELLERHAPFQAPEPPETPPLQAVEHDIPTDYIPAETFVPQPTLWQLLAAHHAAPPPQLSRDVPQPVRDLITRCLARDPADRYATAAELAAALAAQLEHLTDSSTNGSSPL